MAFVLATGVVCLSAEAGAAADVVQAPSGPSGLVALATAEGPVVQTAAGGRTRTHLPAEARVTGLVELTRGWALAATVPTGNGQRATLLVAEDGGRRELPRLPGPSAALQERLAPLAVDGQLVGAAWLEGDGYTGLSVRAADWDGRRWSPAETISRPTHGSQMALSATVLRDGRPLLVWSRFDGSDDEVVFSVRSGGGWTTPAPIHPANRVPDILPKVVATADSGALAIWSELIDDHYRLLCSRFDGRRWGAPRRLPGRGAVATHVLLRGERALLLYESTAPRTWTMAEIDADSARPLRFARVPRETEEAPSIEVSGDGAYLTWRPDGGRRAGAAWRPTGTP